MISSTIDAFNTPLVVTRTEQTVTYVDGIAQPVTETDTFELTGCSLQPMTARERLVLPELIRDRETVKVYTKCRLRGVDMVDKVLADRVTYGEQEFVVMSVEDWTAHGAFYKVVLMKEND